MVEASAKVTLLVPTVLTRTLMRGGRVASVPLVVKVAMSAPVSALTTVKLCTVWADAAAALASSPATTNLFFENLVPDICLSPMIEL